MPDDLKEHFLKALESDSEFSDAHLQLALIYQEERNNKSAEAHFLQAIESDNQKIMEIEKHGEKLLKNYQFQNAKDQLMKAQEKKNHCAEVHHCLAHLYQQQNKLKKAQVCLEKSIVLNPAFAEAFRYLSIVLSEQNEYDAARFQIEKALDLNYSDSQSHFQMGFIMKHAREYSDAEQHFLSAMDIDPQFTECMIALAEMKLDMKEEKEARKYYQKARDISPAINHPKLDKILG